MTYEYGGDLRAVNRGSVKMQTPAGFGILRGPPVIEIHPKTEPSVIRVPGREVGTPDVVVQIDVQAALAASRQRAVIQQAGSSRRNQRGVERMEKDSPVRRGIARA